MTTVRRRRYFTRVPDIDENGAAPFRLETHMPNRYDAIVIGTGQAGPSLAARLAGAGMKVAVIERNAFGGTCVNTGCIPTKTMVASAYAAHLARRAAEYGVDVGGSVRST